MRTLLVWLLLCGVLLSGIAGLLCWVSGESIQIFVSRTMDKNFALGVITAFVAIVAFLAAVMLGSKP